MNALDKDGHAAQANRPAVPRYDVRELLQGAQEATLMLDGQAYRLRITAAGKLILTK